MASSAIEQLRRVLRQLCAPEPLFRELSTRPPPPLTDRLRDIELLVSSITEHYHALLEEYQQEVISLWNGGASNPNSNPASSDEEKNTETELSQNDVAAVTEPSVPKEEQASDLSLPLSPPHLPFQPPLTLETVHSTFDHLPLVSSQSDFESLKLLTAAVVKTRKRLRTSPHLSPTQAARLAGEAFTLAFNLLSPPVASLYSLQYEDASLESLFDFLWQEIRDYRERYRLLLDDGQAAARAASEKNIVTTHRACGLFCRFCDKAGHCGRCCPVKQKLYCFQCFMYGHTVNRRCHGKYRGPKN